jgi:hypothetical protein
MSVQRPRRHEHGSALNGAGREAIQCFAGRCERHPDRRRADGDGRCDREELLTVLASEVRHRAQRSFAPEQLVRERRNVAHVNARAHDLSAWSDGREGCRNQRPHGRKDDGRIEGLGRHYVGSTGPHGAELAGERLTAPVPWP